MPVMKTSILLPATFATLALARTDLVGCTSTDVSSPAGASYAWYVPGTGELCDPLDCGGGRAPPKYDVPGCPQYTGTESYSPSYLPGYGSATAAPASTTAAPSGGSGSSSSSSSFDWDSLISEADTATSSWDLYTSWDSSSTPGTSISYSSATGLASPVDLPSTGVSIFTHPLSTPASSLPASTDDVSIFTYPLLSSSATSAATAPATLPAGMNGTAGVAGPTGGSTSVSRNGTMPSGTASPSSPATQVNGGESAQGTMTTMSGAGFIVALGALMALL
ncbi:hypothetical protein KC331_g4538 [Hortaea werneckii]|uniref:Ig-like domain-containing protein n=1 Tax=Hortaea werneckii TaxID=91943 RepID=A0A3M7D887_HORWE|nr:hypothetical protein KC331_g4538 [Hortaea werneckii]KAI7717568.1 hypothetical protein KC353_g4479 [Hortaea werneckii]RMY60489.1 hypothetical protein D0865_01497 [Hortaea werneckii]